MAGLIYSDENVAALARECRAMLADWETGRQPSPDERDYVRAAVKIAGGDDPDEVVERAADGLAERLAVGDIDTDEWLARETFAQLVIARYPQRREASGE